MCENGAAVPVKDITTPMSVYPQGRTGSRGGRVVSKIHICEEILGVCAGGACSRPVIVGRVLLGRHLVCSSIELKALS